jgi:hypothetical protein
MQYWLDYDEEYFRQTYRERKAVEQQAKPKFSREDLYDLGYTDEEIDSDPGLRGDE